MPKLHSSTDLLSRILLVGLPSCRQSRKRHAVADYSFCWFGNAKIRYRDATCRDNSVKNPVLGFDTKENKKPFDDPLTDVGLQQQCEGKSGAAGLVLAWKVLLPAVGFSILCMMNLAL